MAKYIYNALSYGVYIYDYGCEQFWMVMQGLFSLSPGSNILPNSQSKISSFFPISPQ